MSDKEIPMEKEGGKETPDKKQIEAEEKEKMLQEDIPAIEDEKKDEKSEGPVKAALASTVSEEGREVKPKFIPIGGIKMPGFFTRSRSKERVKDADDGIENGIQGTESSEGGDANSRRKRARKAFQDFWMRVTRAPLNQGENGEPRQPSEFTNRARRIINNIKRPITEMLPRRKGEDPEAALASMETLEEAKAEDGMETVKLGDDEAAAPPRLHWRERVRQKKFIMDDVVAGVAVVVVVAIVAGVTLALVGSGTALREAPLRGGLYVTAVTGCGPVEGIMEDGAVYFRGIPYARPPVGESRWRPARDLDDLDSCWNGTLLAHNATPPCMQMLENGSIVGREDCLTLDVVTPRVRYDTPLPVVVLLGGPSLAGGLEPELRPAPRYARSKDVVFVRPNYRVGLLGFLAIEGLSGGRGPSGNYGLSDAEAALRWVRLNARHFGGDPEAVCVVGHRAGATLAGAIVRRWRRRAAGASRRRPFARVWLSGGGWAASAAATRREADDAGRRAAALAGCDGGAVAACMRSADAARLLANAPDDWRPRVADLPSAAAERPWLVREEPDDTEAAESTPLAAGEVVVGATEHSGHSRTLLLRHGVWTPELVAAAVRSSALGGQNLAEDALRMYDSTYAGLASLVGDLREVCPAYFLSRELGAPFYLVRGDGVPGDAADATPGETTTAAAATSPRSAEETAEEGLVPSGWDVLAMVGQRAATTTARRHRVTALQQMFYHWVWHGAVGGPAGERSNAIVTVAQDAVPVVDLPACQFWIDKKVVPRYARLD